MSDTILVRHPEQLNRKWAQKVVDRKSAGVKVDEVKVVSVDIGTTTRARLLVNHDGPDTLAKRWFVKFPSMSCRARIITALPRLLQTELRFYQELSATVPLQSPELLAGQSKLGQGTTLVLADITEFQATPGRPSDTLTVPQAIKVIDQLANFHVRFWDKAPHDPQYQWLAASVRRLEDNLGTLLAVPLMKRGLKLAGSQVPVALHKPIMRYAKQRKQVMSFLSEGIQTLTHHDCHPGNLFWHQSSPGFLDWQLVRIGEGVGDIAYFLSTALDPEIRKQHEAGLLAGYCQTLNVKGITDIDQNNMTLRYRAHLAYAFEAMILTLAVGGLMPLESNLELIRRTVSALEDHDVFSILPI